MLMITIVIIIIIIIINNNNNNYNNSRYTKQWQKSTIWESPLAVTSLMLLCDRCFTKCACVDTHVCQK